MFPGSGGLIRLRQENGQIKFGQNNFLVRSRGDFVKRGLVTAILDAPSDYQTGWGMGDEFRLGEDHFTDVAAIVAELGKRFPSLPLFLIGTSRGTISAAALGARLDSGLSGVVLTSTMFRAAGAKSNEPGPGLSRFDFTTIKVPLLFVHHVSDQCQVTPTTSGSACEQVPTHFRLWRSCARVRTLRSLQRAWLFRQRVGNRRGNR